MKKKGSTCAIIMVPLSFIIRRMGFSLTLVYWLEFFWGQVAIQLMITIAMIILLQWTRPLESEFATNMETFNECVSLLILYLLMCFSDFVGDPMIRNDCGKAFIAVFIFYVCVHMSILFYDILGKLYHKARKIYYDRRNKKLLAKQAEKEARYREK